MFFFFSFENKKLTDEEAIRILREKEAASNMQFDDVKKDPTPSTEEVVSLGKSEGWKASQEFEQEMKAPLEIGWKPFPVANLPSEGRFYNEGTTIAIKAATVEEIRHFSTIDENDPLDLDDKLNMVMSKCLQIKFPDRHASWKDLKEEDRFCLVFAIRDLTFKNGENKLMLTMRCGNTCSGDGTYLEKIELKNDNFDYYKIDPKLMRFYSADERCFVILNEKLGAPLKIYVPSLGVTTFIKNYMRERIRKGEFYDKTFLKVAPFLFADWRNLSDALYKKVEMDSYGWSPFKLSSIIQVTEMIRFGVKTKLTRTCNKCGAEVSTNLTFPGGIRSLFLYSSPLDDLLS